MNIDCARYHYTAILAHFHVHAPTQCASYVCTCIMSYGLIFFRIGLY